MIARKLMLLGDMGVGKTSLARRLVFDAFETSYKPTIGVDIYRHVVAVPAAAGAAGATTIELIIWDTDGDFGDSIFRHVYLQGAAGALVVADATRPHTQASLVRLADGFSEVLPGRPLAMVMNKSDLVPAEELAERLRPALRSEIPLLPTSALTGANVVRTFADIAAAIVRRGL